MNVFVQFSDNSMETIVSVFGCAQEESSFPNQKVLTETDLRYVEYLESLPPGARAGLSSSEVSA
jgi:hypothetical protein